MNKLTKKKRKKRKRKRKNHLNFIFDNVNFDLRKRSGFK